MRLEEVEDEFFPVAVTADESECECHDITVGHWQSIERKWDDLTLPIIKSIKSFFNPHVVL